MIMTDLSTLNLRLRAVEPEDLDLMYRIENDTTLWQYGASCVPYSRYALRQYIEQNQNDLFRDGQVRFVVENTEGEAMGFADLVNFDPLHHRAEISIVLLPQWHRKGLSIEILALLEPYARIFSVGLLYAYVSVQNKPALRMLRKAGYIEVGVLPCWIYGEDAYALTKRL